MNSQSPHSKLGKVDYEINRITKYLFVLMVLLAIGIVAMNGFRGNWAIQFFRFILLLSYIIPLSLRVNVDISKIYYTICISKDENIEGTIPRNSTIPEELGRI